MKFRTEIDIKPDKSIRLTHADGIVMLGSCFTDNIGALLQCDGFQVTANPYGALYNPLSIENALHRAVNQDFYDDDSYVKDAEGVSHCLDYASRYASCDTEKLTRTLNEQLLALRDDLLKASTLIITLGTSYVYYWNDSSTPIFWKGKDYAVGNCHKFAAAAFTRRMLTTEEVSYSLCRILAMLPGNIANVIFTVSPIRHVGDGLHGNQLSKSTLLLGVEKAMSSCCQSRQLRYFPSYEIMLDDLRDYRFYAADMKHPSDVAIDYIYEQFLTAFCAPATISQAIECRKAHLHSQHRPLLSL